MTIDAIRDDISRKVGKNVEVIHNEGRNKIYKYNGKIIEVYPNIFIVMDHNSKRSFSYHDVLTKTVRVSFKV